MPTKPTIQTLSASSPDILNAVRNRIGGVYADQVPSALNTVESIRNIGNILNSSQPLQNAFLSELINRIGMVIITSRLYDNPWAGFKKGLMEYGETIEDIFVNLANPHQFNPELAETQQFKREIPDVRATFHTMNYQKFYKVTVSNDQLRQAFLSWEGITDLIGRIIDSLYTGANYDEFCVMKYMVARLALDGAFYPITVPAVNTENARAIVTAFKGISNSLEFMSTKYNRAGVSTYSDKRYQWLIVNAQFDATIGVDVLATSFNRSDAEFMGNRIIVDSFSAQDNARLAMIFENDKSYVPFTQDELNALDNIPAVLVDENWFMIFDNFYNMTEKYNGEGLYWNYWYHVWKTFSSSPYANAILFTTDTPAITSVSVTPATASILKGQSLHLNANVVSTGFASKQVSWTVNSDNSSITADGKLYVSNNETASSLTVTATSTYDSTKSNTATITVTA